MAAGFRQDKGASFNAIFNLGELEYQTFGSDLSNKPVCGVKLFW
jgi:hypothetical protein